MWVSLHAQLYTRLNTQNGLPSDHVYRAIQDRDGFIWFITEKGMVKYNGHDMKVFTTRNGLPLNDIWDIRATPDGRIWYFSRSTELGYILNDSVYRYRSPGFDGVFYPSVILQSGNRIGFISQGAFYHLKDSVFEKIPMKGNIGAGVRYENGKPLPEFYYVRDGSGDGMVVYNPNFQPLDTIAGLKGIHFEYRGQVNDSLYIWLSTRYVLIHHLKQRKFYRHSFRQEVKFPRYYATPYGVFVTGFNYLARLSSGMQWKKYRLDSTINAHYTLLDRSNNLWMCTFTDGVFMLPALKRNVSYFFPNRKAEKTGFVDNRPVVGIYNLGFFVFDSVHKRFYPKIQTNDFVYAIVPIDSLKKTIYITDRKLYIEDKKSHLQTVSNVSPKKGIRLLYHGGYFYGIVPGGLNIMDENWKIIRKINKTGLKDIIRWNGQIVLGSSSGIKILKNDSIVPVMNFFTRPVQKLVKVKNRLLVCTDGFGGYMTDLQNIEPMENSGFLSVQSGAVHGDELYLATNRGIYKYRLENNRWKNVKIYDVAHGLPGRVIQDVMPLGEHLLVTGNRGVSLIPGETTGNNTQFLNLYFDGIFVNNRPVQDGVEFSFDKHNELVAEINAVDFSGKKEISYQYLLEPNQKKWTKTTSRKLIFSNLKPGDYRLHIKKENITKTFGFTVLPLWWQTAGARIAGILFVLFLLGLSAWRLALNIQRKRTKKIIREKQLTELQLKALRSQMNPHFVFNSLASIQYFIGQNDLKNSDKYLVKFSKLIRRFFELSKEDEIPLSEEIELLKNYLEIEKMRFGDKLRFKIIVDPQLKPEEIQIPTMLLQPIVENAVNHGIFNKETPGEVVIKIGKKDDRSIQVEIIDDGVGMEQTKKRKRKGMKSSNVLKTRIYHLNQSGKWKIQYNTRPLHPDREDKGNISTFIITKL